MISVGKIITFVRKVYFQQKMYSKKLFDGKFNPSKIFQQNLWQKCTLEIFSSKIFRWNFQWKIFHRKFSSGISDRIFYQKFSGGISTGTFHRKILNIIFHKFLVVFLLTFSAVSLVVFFNFLYLKLFYIYCTLYFFYY